MTKKQKNYHRLTCENTNAVGTLGLLRHSHDLYSALVEGQATQLKVTRRVEPHQYQDFLGGWTELRSPYI